LGQQYTDLNTPTTQPGQRIRKFERGKKKPTDSSGFWTGTTEGEEEEEEEED
jgi:hypothetical protein